MKKIKRSYIVGGLVVLTAGYLAVYQNCAGTHERSADFSISLTQVEAYMQDLQCAVASAGTNTDQQTISAVSNLISIEQAAGSLIYYGEAPSSMGDLDLVAPLEYSTLRPDGGSTPSQIYAFFALSSSGAASLVIGVSDSSPATGTTAVATKKNAKFVFPKNERLAQTSSGQQCTSSNPLNLSTAISAFNDGGSGANMPTYDNDVFEAELILSGTTTLLVRSYDVDGGELQDTIQLEINQIDPNSGQEIYLGDINLTQPD